MRNEKYDADQEVVSEDCTAEEIEDDERRWDDTFARSQDKLRRMASKALENFNAGRTEPLDPDTL